MIVTRTVLLAAFSSLVLATPAFAAPGRDHHTIDSTPCDADGPFDGGFELAAFHPERTYFPTAQQAAPDGEQAAPDDGDEADQGDDPDEGDEDANPDNEGCAEIMVAPYDVMIHPPEKPALPVMLRREHVVVRKPEIA